MDDEKRRVRRVDLEKKRNSPFSLDEIEHLNSLPFF
jgi:hypothetical protein